MTLCEQLKDILDDYFVRFPNMSINSLAARSQVGATTIRRILNLSIKGEPAPHTVLNLVSTAYREKRLNKLLKIVEGPIGELLNKWFHHYVEVENDHKYDVDLNHILEDRINYFIYKLGANRCGVGKADVAELFGHLGLERLDRLVEQGIMFYEKDRYHARDKNFSLDLEIVKEHLPELVKFYRPEDLNKGQNLFYSLSEGLNFEGIQRIKEIQKDAVKKTFQILKSPFYEGNIPYFCVQLCEVMSAPKREKEVYS